MSFPSIQKAAHHTLFYPLLFHLAMDPGTFPYEDIKTVLSLLSLHNILLHGYYYNKCLFGYISFCTDRNFPNCSFGSGRWRKWLEILYFHLAKLFLVKNEQQLIFFDVFYLNNLHNHYATVHNNTFSLILRHLFCILHVLGSFSFVFIWGKCWLLQYPISYPKEMSAVNHVFCSDFPLLSPFPLWVSCQVSSF